MQTSMQNLFQLFIKHHAAAEALEYAMRNNDPVCREIALDTHSSLLTDINELCVPEEEQKQHFQLQPLSNFDVLDKAFAEAATQAQVAVYQPVTRELVTVNPHY